MNKEKIKYSIVGLAVLVLVGGGIYMYKRVQKSEPVISQKNTEIVDTVSDSSKNSESLSVPTVSSDTALKFNTAMSRAQDAFQKKDYARAISFYKEALGYKKSDVVHAGLYTVYSAQSDWIKARSALDIAIQLQPMYVDYWNWKIDLLDEKTSASYQDLKSVYTDALLKVDPKTKINLVTHFARTTENNNQKNEAINLWRYAIDIYPDNAHIYQSEIDRLQQSL